MSRKPERAEPETIEVYQDQYTACAVGGIRFEAGVAVPVERELALRLIAVKGFKRKNAPRPEPEE